MVDGSLKRFARQRPVVLFFALTIAYSWGFAGLCYLFYGTGLSMFAAAPFAWGPLVGGALTVRLRDESVADWIGQLRNWRVGVRWYLFGIAIVMLGTDARTVVAFLLGADVEVQAGGAMPVSAYLFSLFTTLLFAGALEEFGWRGFAQVRLQERYNAVAAAVLIGVVWAAWHLPLPVLLEIGTFTDPTTYVVIQVATSIVLAWVYNSTNGALSVVMFTHAASNMPGLFRVTGETPVLAAQLPITELWYLAVAGAIVWRTGSGTVTEDGSLPTVPGVADGGADTR